MELALSLRSCSRNFNFLRSFCPSPISHFHGPFAFRSSARFAATATPASSSFAALYRKHPSSIPIRPGDVLLGQLVPPPAGDEKTFPEVYFGLKTSTPFHPSELPSRLPQNGPGLPGRLLEIESPFNTPEFTSDVRLVGLGRMPPRSREIRTSSSGKKPEKQLAPILCGRPIGINRGGAVIKVFNVVAFEPMYHVMKLENKSRMMMYTILETGGDSLVLSSYGGWFCILAELLGRKDSWHKAGGGSSRERLSYLKFFLSMLRFKNRNFRMRLDGYGQRVFQPLKF